MNRSMLTTLLAAGLLTLAGCAQKETPAETQSDVASAARQGAEDVAQTQADAMRETAESHEDVALAQAKADYDVAVQRCESMTGDQRDACKGEAKSALDMAQASADAQRASTDAAADRKEP